MDCPICKLKEERVRSETRGDSLSIDCHRCGSYQMSGTAVAMSRSRPAAFGLSAWIRSQDPAGQKPMINSSTLDDVANRLPKYRVSEKQLVFLRALERMSDFPGKALLVFKEFDFPLAWSASVAELEYIIRALMGRGLVSLNKYADPQDAYGLDLMITPQGWSYLDEHARPAAFSNQAFIAMAFASEMDRAWKVGVEPALSGAGYRPYRVDVDPHIDRIDTKVMAEIKNSRLVIADVTLQRPGVYFEAGFAIGLGLPVFWSVREDDLPNVHFDTRQYNHIVWKTEEQLAENLNTFILAIVGRGTAT